MGDTLLMLLYRKNVKPQEGMESEGQNDVAAILANAKRETFKGINPAKI